jgi:hypothetical protein
MFQLVLFRVHLIVTLLSLFSIFQGQNLEPEGSLSVDVLLLCFCFSGGYQEKEKGTEEMVGRGRIS